MLKNTFYIAHLKELKQMKKYYKSIVQPYTVLTKANADLVTAESNFSLQFNILSDSLDKDDKNAADLKNASKILGDQLKKVAALHTTLVR